MNIKKTLALLLVIAMCFSFVPSFAFANDDGQIVYHASTEQMSTEYSGLFIADSLSLSVGGSATLIPRYYYTDGMNNVYVEGSNITDDYCSEISWSSYDENIATVNNGVVTGVAPGTTTIEITATDQYYFPGNETGETCTVTVTASSLTVTFNPNGGTLAEETTNTVTVTSGSTVSAPQVEKPGYTLIGWFPTFTIEGVEQQATDAWDFESAVTSDMTLQAQWTAIQATGISLDQNTLNLNPGNTATLNATVTPEGAVVDTWTTTNSAVATVENGVVTAVGAGSAIITANANGHPAECLVTVTTPAANYVAYVNDIGYETLAAAISAATNGDTIYLAEDVVDTDIYLPAGVILDGTYNETRHTISGNSSVYINAAGGTVRNVDFIDIKNADLSKSPIYGIQLNGIATITNCTFTNQCWDAIQITPVAGAQINITNNVFDQAENFSANARRYVHIQSANQVDFSANITGNTMHGSANLMYTGLEIYFPTDWDNIVLANNCIDNPIGVCLYENTYVAENNRYARALDGFVDANGNNLTIEAMVDANGDNYLFPTLEGAFEYAQANNLTDITLVNDATVTSPINIDGTIVLDLGTHHVYAATTEARPFVLNDGSSLTVNATTGGMIIRAENTDVYGFFRVQGAEATLTLNGGSYSGSPNEAAALIRVLNNGNALTYGVNVALNEINVTTDGQVIRDDTGAGRPVYAQYGDIANRLTVTGGNYILHNAGVNLGGSITAFNLQYVKSTFTNVVMTSDIGACIELDGGSAEFNGNQFTVLNPNNIQSWNASTIGISYNAEATITSGTYSSAAYGVAIFTHGGTYNINGGTITGATAAVKSYYQDGDYAVGIKNGYLSGALDLESHTTCEISGGYFSHAPNANYVAAPLEVVDNTDPATANEYPFTIGAHVHNYVYGAPVWLWKVVNGTWSASSSYTGVCSCGQKTTEILPATITKTETDSEIIYTATDSKDNSDSRTYQKTFKVTYEDDPAQVSGTFLYGAVCKLTTTGEKVYDWSVNDVVRAKATATFYFPVTGNDIVTKTENTETTPQKQSSAVVEASSPAVGQYRYKFVWSIPEGSLVQSAMIYRCKDTNTPLIDDASDLLAQTNLRTIDTKLFVRNGEFTLTGKNLTSGTTQTIMFRLIYTLNGETKTLETPISHIAIQ